MKTQLKADTNAHTIRLHFNDTPEDQALYAALQSSGEREFRTPLPRQVKFQLKMAMGLRPPDLGLLRRLGFSKEIDEVAAEFAASGSAEVAAAIHSTKPPATILRLIPGGAAAVNPENIDIGPGAA